MNIRILKALSGVIEGESLSQLHPGYVYQVSEPFGLQLIALDAAVELRSTDPTSEDIDIARLTGGIHVVPPDRAEDRPEKRRRKRR